MFLVGGGGGKLFSRWKTGGRRSFRAKKGKRVDLKKGSWTAVSVNARGNTAQKKIGNHLLKVRGGRILS